MEFDPTRPIYRQIMEEVRKGAVRGDYAPGTQLPSVRDMAVRMGVNPNTMARAYQELERDGFIEARRGEGSFITGAQARIDSERQQLARSARDRFVAELRSLGLDTAQMASLLTDIEKEVQDG